MSGPSVDVVRFGGYGQPDAARVLESSAHQVFLTHEGVAATNRVTVHQLPIPAEFASGTRHRTFRVALAFDPPVRRERREYIAGTMSVALVRGLTAQQVYDTYIEQPSVADAKSDPSLVRRDLPDDEHRPPMRPGVTRLEANTLIRREFVNGVWDPDHGNYYLVVTHNQSAWSTAQRNAYPEQTYALAVEIAEQGRSNLDLYAAIRARLRARARV